jgi:hypothetical protein
MVRVFTHSNDEVTFTDLRNTFEMMKDASSRRGDGANAARGAQRGAGGHRPPFHGRARSTGRVTRMVNGARAPLIAVCPRGNTQALAPAACGHAEQKLSVHLVGGMRAETVKEQLAMSNARSDCIDPSEVEDVPLHRRARDDTPRPWRPAIRARTRAHAG